MPRSSRSVLRTVLMVCLMAPVSACFDIDLSGLDPDNSCLYPCGYDLGANNAAIPFESKPTPVAGGWTFTSLSVGTSHVCGVLDGASASCWGERDVGTPAYRDVPSPEPMPGTAGIVRISAGQGFTCGLTQDGRALCWGQNVGGELGNGEVGAPSATPIPVSGALAFTTLSATGASYGFPHACGLTAAGVAYCWGSNIRGQLGNGGTTSSSTPVAVSGGQIFESISVGALLTCGIIRGGAAYCWGQATEGQLGDDPRDATDNCGAPGSGAVLPCSMTPVAVSGGHTFTSISAGAGHSCGLDTGGIAYCWGANFVGQLGTGSYLWSFAPARVNGSLRFTAIAVGPTSTCALTPSGDAYCWGRNNLGQLGDWTTVTSSAPVKVLTDLPFASIAVGYDGACALTPQGAAYCWGSNEHGKLGKGS